MPKKLKPSDLKIKTLKAMEGDKDLKDREIYPAPPTHHTIKCRYCDKQARVQLKFTRSCNGCRNSTWFNRGQTEVMWTSWANTPTCDVLPSRVTEHG